MDKITLTREDFIRKSAEVATDITEDLSGKKKAHVATAMVLLTGLFTAKLTSALFDNADEAEQQEEELAEAINKEVEQEEESEKRISEDEYDKATLEILEEDVRHGAHTSLIMLETTCFAQLNRKLFGAKK